jgi:hypothetical protein
MENTGAASALIHDAQPATPGGNGTSSPGT